MRQRLLLVLAAVLATTAPNAGAAASHHRPPRPIEFRPHFRLVATSISTVLTNGRYVVTERARPGLSDSLLDEQTGHRTTISRPGCHPRAMGGPWVLFTCGADPSATVDLYSIPNRSWRALPNTGLEPCQNLGPGCNAKATQVLIGSRWVRYDQMCGDPHCYDTSACSRTSPLGHYGRTQRPQRLPSI